MRASVEERGDRVCVPGKYVLQGRDNVFNVALLHECSLPMPSRQRLRADGSLNPFAPKVKVLGFRVGLHLAAHLHLIGSTKENKDRRSGRQREDS